MQNHLLSNKLESSNLRLPSPLEFIPDLSEKYQVEFWVKRDDLIHPYVSGNKWRKLKYWLQYACEKKISEIITFGGPYSNHLIATAAACGIFGFKSHGMVRGDAVQNSVLDLCRLMGMELTFLSREAYKNQKENDNQPIQEDVEKLMIPEGGKGEFAMKGCAEILDEPNMKADYYIVSAGTGTTAIGLANGLKELDLQSKVIAIACVRDESLKFIENPHLKLLADFAGKGFAKFGEQEINTTKQVFKQYGFLLDPVYTSKSWFGMIQLLEEGFFKKGSKIIFLHTGGVTGWLSGNIKF